MSRTTTALLIVASLAMVACEAPVIGDWQSDKKLGNGRKNKLHVLDDFTGDATIWATPAGQPDNWIRFEFEVDWEDKTETFELELDCKSGPCDGDDFFMDCEVVDTDEGEKLDCKANRKWKDYIFNWERDEE